jgi:hypothetical protein
MGKRIVTPPPVASSSRIRLRPKVWASLFLILGLGVAGNFAWKEYGGQIAHHPQYQLTSDHITITPPPPWIRSDVKSQVLRDSGLLAGVSVLDDWDTLSRRITEAFQFHPWVAAVRKISKRLPSSLDVKLEYRRPVAAVESSDASGISFLPIDEHAVRLPEADLTDAERRYLPRISDVSGRPLVGDAWKDPRVIDGARLAAGLADIWQQLRLVEIIASPQPIVRGDARLYSFDIVTSGGTRIVWGAAPDQQLQTNESTFAEKRKRLLDFAAHNGKLEMIDGPKSVDVRAELVITPREARKKKTIDDATTTK